MRGGLSTDGVVEAFLQKGQVERFEKVLQICQHLCPAYAAGLPAACLGLLKPVFADCAGPNGNRLLIWICT